MNYINLTLAFLLAIFFGINNGSVCQAGIVGSRLLTFRKTVLITGGGLLAGVMVEGWKTKSFVLNIPVPQNVTFFLLLIPLILLALFTFYEVPISIAHILAGSWLGIAAVLYQILALQTLLYLTIAWVLTPFLAMVFSAIIYTYLRRLISRWRLSSVSIFNRIAIIIASFYTAYALGSNNIGLMLGVSQLPETVNMILVIGVLAGMVMMSSRFIKAIGEDFLVVGPLGVLVSLISGSFVIWILTQFGYPASLTNGIIGGVIGIGIISRPKIFNVKKLYQITFSWFTAGALGFITSYTVYTLLLLY